MRWPAARRLGFAEVLDHPLIGVHQGGALDRSLHERAAGDCSSLSRPPVVGQQLRCGLPHGRGGPGHRDRDPAKRRHGLCGHRRLRAPPARRSLGDRELHLYALRKTPRRAVAGADRRAARAKLRISHIARAPRACSALSAAARPRRPDIACHFSQLPTIFTARSVFARPHPLPRASTRRSSSAQPARRARCRWREARPLRDDVSTDEITPVPILTHYDDKLGRYPYTGFKAGGERPIGTDAVRAGGFERHGRRQALRQGLVARAQPGGGEAGRHPAGRSPRASSASTGRTPTTSASSRRPTSACVERIERGEAIADRRAASPAATRSPRRSCAAAGCCASASATCATSRRRRRARGASAPRTLFEKIVARHALRDRADRRAARARARRLRARRLALHPRVLHRHVRAHADAHLRPAAGAARPGVASSCSRTTPPTSTRARRTCAAAWCRTCARCVEAQRDVRRAARPAHRTAR